MKLLSNLLNYLRDSASEIGEGAKNNDDKDDFRLLENELDILKKTSLDAKISEAFILAKHRQADLNIAAFVGKINKAETNFASSIVNDNEIYIVEGAEYIEALRIEKKEGEKQAEHFYQCAQEMAKQIQILELQINTMERQLQQFKATDAVQNIQESLLAGRNTAESVKKNLLYIEDKQAFFDARLEAVEELEKESDLENKLHEAGIVTKTTSD